MKAIPLYRSSKENEAMSSTSDAGRTALIFAAVSLIGMSFIVVSKITGLSQVVVTTVPVLIMFGYGLALIALRSLRLRDDQSGDNLYYLGFLYTLTSLGVSLYQFSINSGAEEIITNFGIAISTTIVGLMLRVAFNQMRRDPAEIEAVTRMELADAARRVRRELDNTIIELNHFQRAAQQSTQDRIEELESSLKKILETSLSSLEKISSAAASSIQTSGKEYTDSVRETLGTLVQYMQGLSHETEKISGALEKVSDKLNSMKSPDEIIELKMAPTIEKIDQLTSTIARINSETAEALREINTDSAISINKINKDSAESIKTILDSVHTASRNISRLNRPGILKLIARKIW